MKQMAVFVYYKCWVQYSRCVITYKKQMPYRGLSQSFETVRRYVLTPIFTSKVKWLSKQ